MIKYFFYLYSSLFVNVVLYDAGIRMVNVDFWICLFKKLRPWCKKTKGIIEYFLCLSGRKRSHFSFIYWVKLNSVRDSFWILWLHLQLDLKDFSEPFWLSFVLKRTGFTQGDLIPAQRLSVPGKVLSSNTKVQLCLILFTILI